MVRIPHFGHLMLLGALTLIVSGIGMVAALHFKLGRHCHYRRDGQEHGL